MTDFNENEIRDVLNLILFYNILGFWTFWWNYLCRNSSRWI